MAKEKKPIESEQSDIPLPKKPPAKAPKQPKTPPPPEQVQSEQSQVKAPKPQEGFGEKPTPPEVKPSKLEEGREPIQRTAWQERRLREARGEVESKPTPVEAKLERQPPIENPQVKPMGGQSPSEPLEVEKQESPRYVSRVIPRDPKKQGGSAVHEIRLEDPNNPGEYVGHISLRKRPDGNYETHKVEIIEELRRRGLGTRLYQEAAEYARSQGGKLFQSGERSRDADKLHGHFQEQGNLTPEGEIKFSEENTPTEPTSDYKVVAYGGEYFVTDKNGKKISEGIARRDWAEEDAQRMTQQDQQRRERVQEEREPLPRPQDHPIMQTREMVRGAVSDALGLDEKGKLTGKPDAGIRNQLMDMVLGGELNSFLPDQQTVDQLKKLGEQLPEKDTTRKEYEKAVEDYQKRLDADKGFPVPNPEKFVQQLFGETGMVRRWTTPPLSYDSLKAIPEKGERIFFEGPDGEVIAQGLVEKVDDVTGGVALTMQLQRVDPEIGVERTEQEQQAYKTGYGDKKWPKWIERNVKTREDGNRFQQDLRNFVDENQLISPGDLYDRYGEDLPLSRYNMQRQIEAVSNFVDHLEQMETMSPVDRRQLRNGQRDARNLIPPREDLWGEEGVVDAWAKRIVNNSEEGLTAIRESLAFVGLRDSVLGETWAEDVDFDGEENPVLMELFRSVLPEYQKVVEKGQASPEQLAGLLRNKIKEIFPVDQHTLDNLKRFAKESKSGIDFSSDQFEELRSRERRVKQTSGKQIASVTPVLFGAVQALEKQKGWSGEIEGLKEGKEAREFLSKFHGTESHGRNWLDLSSSQLLDTSREILRRVRLYEELPQELRDSQAGRGSSSVSRSEIDNIFSRDKNLANELQDWAAQYSPGHTRAGTSVQGIVYDALTNLSPIYNAYQNEKKKREVMQHPVPQKGHETQEKSLPRFEYETKSEEKRKFGCLMAIIPDPLRKEMTDWCLENVPEFHLGPGGREHRPHLTIKFGFVEDLTHTFAKLKTFFKQRSPFTLKLNGFDLFTSGYGKWQNEDGDVLFTEVEKTSDLMQLNKEISDKFDCHDTHPEYKPHMTVAYLDPSVSDRYKHLVCPWEGREVVIEELVYSGASKKEDTIPLSPLKRLEEHFGNLLMIVDEESAKTLSYLDTTAGGALVPPAQMGLKKKKPKQTHFVKNAELIGMESEEDPIRRTSSPSPPKKESTSQIQQRLPAPKQPEVKPSPFEAKPQPETPEVKQSAEKPQPQQSREKPQPKYNRPPLNEGEVSGEHSGYPVRVSSQDDLVKVESRTQYKVPSDKEKRKFDSNAGSLEVTKQGDTWRIMNIYVPEAMRKQGIAFDLIKQAVNKLGPIKTSKVFSESGINLMQSLVNRGWADQLDEDDYLIHFDRNFGKDKPQQEMNNESGTGTGRSGDESTPPDAQQSVNEVPDESPRSDSEETDQGGETPEQSSSRQAERVAASKEEIHKRLGRFQKLFLSRGNPQISEWLGELQKHINEVGGEDLLEALGENKDNGGESVQYGGVDTDSSNWSKFVEDYLNRSGITPITPAITHFNDERLIVSQTSPDWMRNGEERDFRPRDPIYNNKLEEAKDLPGLEKSEDINRVMGRKITHLTPDVVAKMNRIYGENQWIIKAYGQEASAGYGIFFPQRIQQIRRDAQNTIATAADHLAKYGFKLGRSSKTGRVRGIIHEGGEIYKIGTEKYINTIQGEARKWADIVAAATANEAGAVLPDGGKDFMVQPAFAAVGVSDTDRAAGKTIAPGEGRTHVVVRNGKAELIPHSTWIKGEAFPVVFESDDTRAMAQAAVDAINQLPEGAKNGQLYAPDILKTRDGYRVVELNASDEQGASGYLSDNPMIIDSYVSHLTGRSPAHVQFIRKLLSRKKREGSKSLSWSAFVKNTEPTKQDSVESAQPPEPIAQKPIAQPEQPQVKTTSQNKPPRNRSIPKPPEVKPSPFETKHPEVESIKPETPKIQNRIFYRGTNRGGTRRIDEPFEEARGLTFAARKKESAQNYGSDIEEIEAKPEARILDQDSPEFWRLLGKRKPPNGHLASVRGGMIENVNEAIRRARAAGYDAISFSQDSDVGTVIINEDKFNRQKSLSSSDVITKSAPPNTPVKESSYFSECERDDGGQCLPKNVNAKRKRDKRKGNISEQKVPKGSISPDRVAIQEEVLDSLKNEIAGAKKLATVLKQASWERLTPGEQKIFKFAAACEHALAKIPETAQQMVEDAAKERGLSEEQAKAAKKIAKAADLIAGWTVNIPAAHTGLHEAGVGEQTGEAGTFVLAKLAYYIPVGSLCYLAYSAMESTLHGDPLAIVRAARSAIRSVMGKKTETKSFDRDELETLLVVLEQVKDAEMFFPYALAAMDLEDDFAQAMELALTAYQKRTGETNSDYPVKSLSKTTDKRGATICYDDTSGHRLPCNPQVKKSSLRGEKKPKEEPIQETKEVPQNTQLPETQGLSTAEYLPPPEPPPPPEQDPAMYRPSKPEERQDHVPPVLPWRSPPPPKATGKGKGPVERKSGAESQTKLGDHAEELAAQMGLRSILPEGRRSNVNVKEEGSSFDREYDHSGWGFEIKACRVTSTEYKCKAKASKKEDKERYAKIHKLKPATMIAVVDEEKQEIHYYWHEGLTAKKVPIGSDANGWNYSGTVKY